VELYLLCCPRWAVQQQKMSDVIVKNDAQASMTDSPRENERLLLDL